MIQTYNPNALWDAVDRDDSRSMENELRKCGGFNNVVAVVIDRADDTGANLLTRSIDAGAFECFKRLTRIFQEANSTYFSKEDEAQRTPAGAILLNQRGQEWLDALHVVGWDPKHDFRKTIGYQDTWDRPVASANWFPSALVNADTRRTVSPREIQEIVRWLPETADTDFGGRLLSMSPRDAALDIMLITAASCGHRNNVRAALEAGADPSRKYGQFAVTANAFHNPDMGVIDELVDHGASLKGMLPMTPNAILNGMVKYWPDTRLQAFLSRYGITPADLLESDPRHGLSVLKMLAEDYLAYNVDRYYHGGDPSHARKIETLVRYGAVDDVSAFFCLVRTPDNGHLFPRVLDLGVKPERFDKYGGIEKTVAAAVTGGATENLVALHDRGYDVINQPVEDPDLQLGHKTDVFDLARRHSVDPETTLETLARLQELGPPVSRDQPEESPTEQAEHALVVGARPF